MAKELCNMKTTIGDIQDYIKGNRIGSREAELENSSGWKAVRKVHRSKRSYNRKDKHKSGQPDFFMPVDVVPARTYRSLDQTSFSATYAEKHSNPR